MSQALLSRISPNASSDSLDLLEPVHELQALMIRTNTYEDLVRWARCLSEIMKQAGQLCQESARASYVEVSSRLQVCLVVSLPCR